MPNIPQKPYPKILQVETGHITQQPHRLHFEIDTLDYKVYDQIPRFWRSIEKIIRLDIYLALKAKEKEKEYDLIWAGSEKVGIPLSFLKLMKPLVVVAHHIESGAKSKFLKLFKVTNRWAGIGYTSLASKKFFLNYFNIPEALTFQCYAANWLKQVKNSSSTNPEGHILSIGVAKRDYQTLISSLSALENYHTKIFVSSQFGDTLKAELPTRVPHWVQFPGYVTTKELMRQYEQSRFIVIPLECTEQGGAGTTAFLEAATFGKAVIATKTIGSMELIEHGVNGFLVPPNDSLGMQQAIQTLWSKPDLAERMGRANRQFVESKFNPEIVNARINSFLKQLLY